MFIANSISETWQWIPPSGNTGYLSSVQEANQLSSISDVDPDPEV